MKTIKNLSWDYATKIHSPVDQPPINHEVIAKAWHEGYLEGFSDLLKHNQEVAAKEHWRNQNLARVHSFHTEAIKLIERAMKELE